MCGSAFTRDVISQREKQRDDLRDRARFGSNGRESRPRASPAYSGELAENLGWPPAHGKFPRKSEISYSIGNARAEIRPAKTNSCGQPWSSIVKQGFKVDCCPTVVQSISRHVRTERKREEEKERERGGGGGVKVISAKKRHPCRGTAHRWHNP